MRVVTADQMKQIEEASLRYDLTYQRLMENAGAAAAAYIRRTFSIEGLNCLIFSGPGNNGGDGFVVARKLIENGANVLVVLIGGTPKSPEAQSMYDSIELMGLPVLRFEEHCDKVMGILQKADIVVDAIYGTGFHGELGPWQAKACEAINNAIAAVISLDIPSGVECDTGRPAYGAVLADFTIAFDALKPVHILPLGKAHCGIVETVDIGIPDEARRGIPSLFGDITTETVMDALPHRAESAHKGDFGKVLVVAGSSRYRGAAALATLGALRCGAGLVTLAGTREVVGAAAAKLYECTFVELPQSETGGIAADTAIPLLRESLRTATAVLFGCGMGNTPDTEKLLHYLLRNQRCPVVVDADGINALSSNINVLKEANEPVILTPHPGEMARLCGTTAAQIQSDRTGAAIDFAAKHNVTMLLKGHESVIASPEGRLLVNRTGNAGLAKGGSGDVLAGMVAAFAAQGAEPVMAAAAAAHLHGLAADEAAKRLSQYAMLPSDLPDFLAEILAAHGR